MSINNQGVIVGTFKLNPADPFRGFMWKDGVFSNLNPPDSGGHSSPVKISNAGDVVGGFFSTVDGLPHGFSFDQGRFTQIDVPGLQQTGITAVNKFDNVLAGALQGTKNVVFKGFCKAVF
jgi:probable HAF family extracellular repeat protein